MIDLVSIRRIKTGDTVEVDACKGVAKIVKRRGT